MQTLFMETVIQSQFTVTLEKENQCPLRMWNSSVQKLTCVKKEKDLKPAYKELVESLNEIRYNYELSEDTGLFVEDSEYSEESEIDQESF